MDLSSMQGLMVIVGPIVLGAAIIWAVMHNKGNKRDIQRTEEATARNYDRQSAEDKLNGGG